MTKAPGETENTTGLQYRGHIPGIDVLRGLAIALVLLYHGVDARLPWQFLHGPLRYLVYATSWGATGVHLFFILSGFLITGILIDSRGRRDYWKRFYTSRALRILPAYLLMLAILKASHTVSWRFVLAAVLYAANMARAFGAANAEYGSLWSLAVEEQFYLLWPLVVRRASLRTLQWIAIAVIVLSPALFFAIEVFGHNVDSYYKLWGNACWLFAGALVALALRTGSLHRSNIKPWTDGLIAAALLGIPYVIDTGLNVHASLRQANAVVPFSIFPIAAIYVALLLLTIRNNRGPGCRRNLFTRAAAFLGYLSYGLYLVHSLVFEQLDHYFATTRFAPYRLNPLWIACTAVAYSLISIAIAYASRRYFEEWFLRRKPKPKE